MEQQQVFVEIDVGKRRLEVALSSGAGFAVDNDEAGVAELIDRLGAAAPALAVLGVTPFRWMILGLG